MSNTEKHENEKPAEVCEKAPSGVEETVSPQDREVTVREQANGEQIPESGAKDGNLGEGKQRKNVFAAINKKALSAGICAVVLVAAAVFVFTQFVFAAGSMYSVRTEALDFRGKLLTEENFLELSEKLPNCRITWDVPFQGSHIASDAKEISVTALAEEDIRLLDYVTGLETVRAEECGNYLELARLQQQRPDVDVRYSVPLSGGTYSKDTEELTLTGMTKTDATRLPALLQLRKVEVSNCDDYELLQQLQKDYPQWNLTYTVRVGHQVVGWDTPIVQTENTTAEELAQALAGLPKLEKLEITNPATDFETLFALREQYPNVKLTWVVEFYDQTFTEDTREVNFSGIPMSCEEAEQVVACLPNLEKLIMSDCGIDDETMAQFRERKRENYKVVWTVYLGNICSLRTDAIFFHPYQQGEGYFFDEEAVNLKYCEDIICLDLGHHDITNIDFVKYMPHLKYLILAHTRIRDVSAIVDCQELIYLEIDWTRIQDLSPLVELKALEDLNLSRTYCDLTPVLEMTWLKNLWVPNKSPEDQERLIASLPDTHLELNAVNTKGWRHLANYYAQRDILGMEYMNQ